MQKTETKNESYSVIAETKRRLYFTDPVQGVLRGIRSLYRKQSESKMEEKKTIADRKAELPHGDQPFFWDNNYIFITAVIIIPKLTKNYEIGIEI